MIISTWFILLSVEQHRLDQYDHGTAGITAHSITDGGAEPSLQLNSSAFLQALDAPRRPLLVRFDWYSKKVTPVHIGYVF